MIYKKEILLQVVEYLMNEKVDLEKMDIILDSFNENYNFKSIITSKKFREDSVNKDLDIEKLLYNKKSYRSSIAYMKFDTYVNLETPDYSLITNLLSNSRDAKFYNAEYLKNLIKTDIKYFGGIIHGLLGLELSFADIIKEVITLENLSNYLSNDEKIDNPYFSGCLSLNGNAIFKEFLACDKKDPKFIQAMINYFKNIDAPFHLLKPIESKIIIGLVEYLLDLDLKFFEGKEKNKFKLLINFINSIEKFSIIEAKSVFLKIMNKYNTSEYHFDDSYNVNKLLKSSTIQKEAFKNKNYRLFKNFKKVPKKNLEVIFNSYDKEIRLYEDIIPRDSELTPEMLHTIAENEPTFFGHYSYRHFLFSYNELLKEEGKNIIDEFYRIDSGIFKNKTTFRETLISSFGNSFATSKVLDEHPEYFLDKFEDYEVRTKYDVFLKLVEHIIDTDKVISFDRRELKVSSTKISELSEMEQYIYYCRLLETPNFGDETFIKTVFKLPKIHSNKLIKQLVFKLSLKK